MLRIFAIAFMAVCLCAADAVAGCPNCSVRLGPNSGASVQVYRSQQGIIRSRQGSGRRSIARAHRAIRHARIHR